MSRSFHIALGGLLLMTMSSACGTSSAIPDGRAVSDTALPSTDARHSDAVIASDGTVVLDSQPDASRDADSLDDAGSPDAASFDASPAGAVSVLVLDPATQMPAMGVPVLFESPAGVVNEVDTDSTGTATATILPNAIVTAVELDNTVSAQLQSIEGVQPGDSLTFGTQDVRPPATTGSQPTITVSVPSYDGGANGVYFMASCGGGSQFSGLTPTTAPISLAAGCTHTALTIMSLIYDSASGSTDVVQFIAVPDQSIIDGQQINITDDWTTPDPITLDISDIPSPITVGNINVGNATFDLSLVAPDTYQADASFVHHLPFVAPFVINVSFIDDSNGRQTFTATSAQQFTSIDAQSLLLPWVDGSATYDTESRQIDWTQSGSGNPDAVFASLRYTDSNQTRLTWAIVAPPDASTIPVPSLPDAFSSEDPAQPGVGIALYSSQPSTAYSVIRAAQVIGGKGEVVHTVPAATSIIESR